MARIAEQTIEQIRSSIDIIDLIGQYVQLKQRGHNFFGICPFHLEKTPSFAVNPNKQIYKCFGCGAGGGTINFIMAIEKLEFIEAIKFLAEKYNIEIDLNTNKSNKLFSQLFEIHTLAANFYHKNLLSNNKIIEYLNSRGIKNESIKEFQIGFSQDNWSALLEKIRSKGFTSEAMVQSGLFINGKKGYYDRFRNRIMFPISDRNSKIIAFGGRVFDSEDPAKYINSSETPIYNKSGIFFGLSKTKNFLSKENTAIVVEGYLDLIQLFQNDIKNVVAVSGTSFTDNHAIELNKYVKTVKIAYDGDDAGKNAAIRAGYVLLKNGFNPEIVPIPDGKDPDDWIQQEGPEPLKEVIQNSIDLFKFHFDHSKANDNSPNMLTNLINNMISEISTISDPIHRELCIKSISRVTKLNENTLFESFNKLNSKIKFTPKNIVSPNLRQDPHYNLLEDELIQLCFSEEDISRLFIYENINQKWIVSESIKTIFNEIFIHLHSEHMPDINVIMDGIKDSKYREKFSSLVFDLDKKNLSIKAAIECLKRLEETYLKNKLFKLREEIPKSSKEIMKNLIVEISDIQKAISNIKLKYNEIEKN